MLKKQNNYDFKSELLIIHQPNIIDNSLVKEKDEFAFFDGIKILVENPENIVIMTAVRDFEDYLFTSMNISSHVKKSGDAEMKIRLGKDLGEADGYMGYRITVSENGVLLEGHDERGVAQGL